MTVATELRIERCDTAARGDEIKALFVRNARPSFAPFFDRAYPTAYAGGGSSWLAHDADGGLVGHFAAFPRRFRTVSGAVRGALLMDLLFDAPHRNFWSAVALVRRAITDLRSGPDAYDFAYTDPTPPAEPVLRAVGFRVAGRFHRFVAPLHPLYRWLHELRAQSHALPHGPTGERRGWDWESRVTRLLEREGFWAAFRAERSVTLYRTRLGGEEIADWEWLSLAAGPPRAGQTDDTALLLVSQRPGKQTATLVDLLWDGARATLDAVLLGAMAAVRDAGFTRLSVVTLGSSPLARALGRTGYVSRGDELPLLTLRLKNNTAVPPVEDWLLTAFDGSAW
jgi:hypothetical protein